jgi:hypothetical protein
MDETTKQQSIPDITNKAIEFQSYKYCVVRVFSAYSTVHPNIPVFSFYNFSESHTIPYKANQSSKPTPSPTISISKLETVQVIYLYAMLFAHRFCFRFFLLI